MRLALAALFVFAVTTTVQADAGQPNSQVLADMGLSGMRVLSDREGLAIRGYGNGPKDREPSEKFVQYEHHLTQLRTHVDEFRTRVGERGSNAGTRYSDGQSNFRSSVSGFKSKIGG
jgi:hypothetical protein